MAHILRERERILRRTQFGGQRGCVSVVVRGKKDGRFREIRFHLASQSQALGEGTGIPAAVGALLLLQGKVKGPGVVPPEAGVNPGDFIGMIPQVMALDPQKEGGKSFGGVILEQVDEHGRITKIDV
jgi:saccharopine dehydrogenase (NAD+, L-lysine-forming)